MRFFGKIRKVMLQEGNSWKYLKYAVGEILLVVIGILIALQVDNWNTQRQQESDVEKLIVEVEKELLVNLESFKQFNTFWKNKDSLIQLVLDGSLTRLDYEQNRSLRSIIPVTVGYIINDDAYIQLLAKRASIPEKYADVLYALNEIYQGPKLDVDDFNDEVSEYAKETLKFWSFHPPWGNGKFSDKMDYMINDPLYKERVRLFEIYYGQNLWRQAKYFQAGTIKVLQLLSECSGEVFQPFDELYSDLVDDVEPIDLKTCEDSNSFSLDTNQRSAEILVLNRLEEAVYFYYLSDSGEELRSKLWKCEPDKIIYGDVSGKHLMYRIKDVKGKCLGTFQVGQTDGVVLIE